MGRPAAAAVAAPAPDPSSSNLNTSAHLQVLGLGTDAGDAVPSALLFFDRRRILFNAGEGFQRYATEHGHRLARVSDLLLTRVTPDAAGGLPGLCLTLADAGAATTGGPPIRVVGPPGLGALAAALRTFVDTRVTVIAPEEVGVEESDGGPSGRAVLLPPVVEDGVVTITPLLLVPPRAEGDGGEDGGDGDAAAADGGGSGGEDASGAEEEGGAGPARPPKRARNTTSTPSRPTPTTLALAYICALAPIPGRFLPAAAIAAGVRPGPLFGALKAGRAVQAGDGTWVQPGQVMEAGSPGPVALIVDAPTAGHAAVLRGATQPGGPLAAWAAGGDGAPNLAAVVHLTHADVVGTTEYVAFAAALGCGLTEEGGGDGATDGPPSSSTPPPPTHLFANEAATGGEGVMRASATLAARLNALQPDLFPLHRVGVAAAYGEGGDGGGVDLDKTAASTTSPPPSGLLPGGTPGRNLVRLHLRPLSKAGLDASSVAPALDVPAIQAELRAAHGGVLAAGAAAWAAALAAPRPPGLARLARGAVQLLFLGTGAAQPSKYRNVSGTYVRLQPPAGGAGAPPPPLPPAGLLLDCGEGTLGQLRRRYGAGGARAALASLAAVWISHIHADHHAGLPGLLLARAAAVKGESGSLPTHPIAPPLLVLGPRPMRRVLEAYARLYDLHYHFVDCADVEDGRQTGPPLDPAPAPPPSPPPGPDAAAVAGLLAAAGLARLATVRVDHCAHAFGLILDVKVRASGGGGDGGDGTGGPVRLAFSGDTRAPCPALVAAAAGAALMVHEATFEDDLADEAAAKKHATTSAAIGVGRAVGADLTLLTHFSQRYPKVPVIPPDLAGGVGLAFDLLGLDLADAGGLPALVQPVRRLFEGLEEEKNGGEQGE